MVVPAINGSLEDLNAFKNGKILSRSSDILGTKLRVLIVNEETKGTDMKWDGGALSRSGHEL